MNTLATTLRLLSFSKPLTSLCVSRPAAGPSVPRLGASRVGRYDDARLRHCRPDCQWAG
jgi:hypothetical protein